MLAMKEFLGAALLLYAAQPASAFYLPGAAPHDYKLGDEVKLFVNALTPMIGTGENAKLVSQDIRSSFDRQFAERATEIGHKL